ncbi:pentatricopeptide repeat-containing protein, partial [Tanacetum coccineum]
MSVLEPLLKKCVTISHIKQLQAHLVISGVFDSYPFTRAKFLDFCAVSAAGSLLYARQIFNHITFPVTNDWNAIIRGLAQSDTPLDAITLYCRGLRCLACKPDALTCSFALKACARTLACNEAMQVHSQVSDTPLDAITLYCQGLRFLPCKPDALTCSFALKACARTLACNEAMQVHSQVVRHGFVGDVLLQTTLLDVYAKCGELDNACKFELMRCPRENTLLGACKTYGNLEMAEKASRKLVEMGSSSDGDFVLLSNIYAAQHRWKDVGRVRDNMKIKEVKK